MKVFNDLFSPSKSDFPEQQQTIDTWTQFLDSFKKNIKSLQTFFQDLTTSFETYGKQLSKQGRNLVTSLSKLTTSNSKHLSECLRACGSYSEVLGAVYSKSASALSITITQKISKVTETASELKKRITEDTSGALKELSQAKMNHLKVKVKYEKAKKDYEQALGEFSKLNEDPANSYQPALTQRAREKMKKFKKEVNLTLKSLNEHVTVIHSKSSLLENVLFNINSHTVGFEQDTAGLIMDILALLIQMFNDIVSLRKEQASVKQEQLAHLANITLDMVNSKESETNNNILEFLSLKLDARVNSCEDRLKVIRCFKGFIAEVVAQEEALAKFLEKMNGNFVMPEYFDTKLMIKSAWTGFSNSLFEISKLYLEETKEISKKTLEPLSTLIQSQTNLARSLQSTVQKIIKDHALTHEECLKEYERHKRQGESTTTQKKAQEIKEKMQTSNQITENMVLTCLTDNSNIESSHFQVLKVTLISLYSSEDSFNSNFWTLIKSSEHLIREINIAEDFKDAKIYTKKDLPSIASFGQSSLTSESVENEEDEQVPIMNDFLQKFGLKSGTYLIESFSCALSSKLLLQGRLYLTSTHICFHSYFNSTTIFGRETAISIPLADIVRIEKRSVLFFENSLCLVTKSGSFLFKSVLYREQAYATLENLLKLNDPSAQVNDKSCEICIEARRVRLEIRKAMMTPRAVSHDVVSRTILKSFLLEQPLKVPVSPLRFFELFFADGALEFITNYLLIQGNLDPKITPWFPPIPDFFSTQDDSIKYVSTRKAEFQHPVKDRLPFMPKYCNCSETHTAHFLSKNEIIVDHEVSVSGVPLSDCFVAYLQFSIKGEEESFIEIRYGVKFLKTTVFRGKIEDSGVSQSKLSMIKVWIPRVLSKIEEVQGVKVQNCTQVVEVIEEKKEFSYWSLGLHFLEIVVIIWLALWVKSLQSKVDLLMSVLDK